MDTIGTFDNLSYKLLDVDLASGGTVRSLVVRDALSRSGCSVQLTITGSSPANLVLRVLGKNTAPASDTERLLPLSLAVPDLSALVADYTGVFLLPMYTAYMQLEVQSISGADVHVRADVLGTNAAFDDAAPTTTIAGVVQLAGTLAAAIQADLDALAATISSGSIKALLQAGSAAIGKLAANSGVNIGSVDVLTLPSLVLAAGVAAIGKLAANAGVNIGSVDVLTLPSIVLAAGANAIGKLAANAGINIGTVDVAVYTPFIDTVASADTSAHAYATSQVVKAPAFARVARTTTGTVTISDGTRTGMALSAGDSMPVYCTNLNTITYQFSVNAATEKFSLSAGI